MSRGAETRSQPLRLALLDDCCSTAAAHTRRAMAAPFSFNMPTSGAAFTMGVAAAAAAPAPSSSAASSSAAAGPSVHVPSVVRADVFPANLSASSLPPASLLLVVPALHPHRGRVLLSSVAREAGQPLLCETAVVASNWDSFRCAHCDRPHATKRCAGAKKIWAKKVLNHLAEVEGSIMEAVSHSRSANNAWHCSAVNVP